MEWPLRDPATGEFKTTPTAQTVWIRAAEAALADISEDQRKIKPKVEAFKEKVKNCDNWRFEYREILYDFFEIMAMASNEQALDMAQAGIDALHDQILFRIDENTSVPCKDIFMLSSSFEKLRTVTVMGTKPPDIDFQFGLTNPQNLQDTLYGYDACAQIDAWFKYGVLETSASSLSKTTMMNSNLQVLVSNKRFVLLGCTSELGPAKSLLQIPGATIMGVSRGGERLDNLLEFVQYHSPDDTTFIYPEGGADLISQGPQIVQWILDNTSEKDEIVLCPLAYLDGESNVRVVVAQDLIVQRVLRQRPTTILSQYLSPATVMVLPPTCSSACKQRLSKRPMWEKITTQFSFGKWLQPSAPEADDCNDYCILNGLVSVQGPNYALAKTLQMWRCMVAYYRDELVVSAPFAPATRTASMKSHSQVAAALEGMHHFEPMLAFDVAPASCLMTAIMLAQIQLMNRPVPDMDESPFAIFWEGSVHGGVWTCPYTLDSLSTINFVLGKTYYPAGYIPEGALPEVMVAGESAQPKRSLEEILGEDSLEGKPMPSYVKERLDFM